MTSDRAQSAQSDRPEAIPASNPSPSVSSCDDLSVVLAQLDHPAALLDGDRRLLAFNPALVQFLGVADTPLQGQPYWDAVLVEAMAQGLWSESDVQQLQRAVQTAGSDPTPLILTTRERAGVCVQVTPMPSGGMLLTLRPQGHSQLVEVFSAEMHRQLMTLESALESAIDGIAILNDAGHFIYLNSAHLNLFGYDQSSELLGQSWHCLYDTPEARRIEQTALPVLFQTGHWRGEAIAQRRDGSTFYEEITLTRIDTGGLVCVCRDISDQKQAEEALRQAEERYRSIFENAIEGIFQSTPDGHYLNVNPALARIYGYASPEDLIATITDINTQVYVDPERRLEFIRLMQETGEVSEFESLVYRQDGSVIWISENARSVYGDNNTLLYYEGTVEDITVRKESEEQLLLNAFYDSLTQLPNRALFMNRLKVALNQAPHRPNHLFALLFIDLDHFKSVNDRLGHPVGDLLLMQVSQRLQECVRAGDTVARLGGDEFAILLENIQSVNDAIHVAERIQETLSKPFHLQTNDVFTSASVGITMSRDQTTGLLYQTLEDLLRNADIAMYRAKHLGKACHEVFDSTIHTTPLPQMQLETDLRRALDQHQLLLYYQPIVKLTSRQIQGFEALLRWQHPTRGLMLPGEFLAIAEERGLIGSLEKWALHEACQTLHRWESQGLIDPLLTISVNLASQQFMHSMLSHQIRTLLQDTAIAPHRLRLEIPECVMMNDRTLVIDNLRSLKELGVQLCIGDFGTGYLSLSRLHQFPIDTLKIDRTFIHGLGNRGDHWTLVKTLLNLASSLGMQVIAEGIETVEQLVQLTTLGCEYGQGYLFSSPVDVATAEELVTRRTL